MRRRWEGWEGGGWGSISGLHYLLHCASKWAGECHIAGVRCEVWGVRCCVMCGVRGQWGLWGLMWPARSSWLEWSSTSALAWLSVKVNLLSHTPPRTLSLNINQRKTGENEIFQRQNYFYYQLEPHGAHFEAQEASYGPPVQYFKILFKEFFFVDLSKANNFDHLIFTEDWAVSGNKSKSECCVVQPPVSGQAGRLCPATTGSPPGTAAQASPHHCHGPTRHQTNILEN